MIVPLPWSGPICHIPPFISINYHQKKKKNSCLLGIKKNHSPRRASDNETSHGAAWCGSPLFRAARFKPTLTDLTNPPPPACRARARWQLTEEGGWSAAADPPAPVGLAGRTRSSMGSEPGLNINKRNVRDLTERGSAFFLPYMKHHTD